MLQMMDTQKSHRFEYPWNHSYSRMKRLFLKTAGTPDKEGRRFVSWETFTNKTGLTREDLVTIRTNHGVWRNLMMQIALEMYPMKAFLTKDGIYLRAR